MNKYQEAIRSLVIEISALQIDGAPLDKLHPLHVQMQNAAALCLPKDMDEERDAKVRAMAQEEHGTDECEIDDDAIVSEGDDSGAFVAAWVWVSFAETPLDKEAQAS